MFFMQFQATFYHFPQNSTAFHDFLNFKSAYGLALSFFSFEGKKHSEERTTLFNVRVKLHCYVLFDFTFGSVCKTDFFLTET